MSINYQDETKEQSLERIFTEITNKGASSFREVTYLQDRPDRLFFDKDICLDKATFLEFIKASQPQQYKNLSLRAGDLVDKKIIDGFTQSVERLGLLYILKHGFKVLSMTLKAFCSLPEDLTDPKLMMQYESNRFYCTRQFHYSNNQTKRSIDMVLLINGIPIVAVEVKNNFTGQSSTDAITQFCTDRDQKELMFRLNRRCLVMFAVDNYDVQMTTKLDGMNTNFIPFNQGSEGPGKEGSKGNPIPPDNVPTHYLFDEVLTKENLSRIVYDYMTYVDDGEKSKVIFPRYHQFHCVNHLLNLAIQERPGHSYLVQHSAGSGKSNTIAWLAYRLLYLQDCSESIFDSVIICVHRTVLNDQLNSTVAMFDTEKSARVAYVNSSRELREALINGCKVVVSTIQKFGMISESLKPYKRNFAIIFDEAHTSSTGKLNKKTKAALGVREIKDVEYDALSQIYATQEEILAAYEKIKHDGNQDNMSFYAFTATPTEKTLHAFGKRLPDGSYDAHHHYCMRQAIEEGFICDVLEDCHTYEEYFDLMSMLSGGDDKYVDKKKVMKILHNMVKKNELIILNKARIIVDYFMEHTANDLNGRAKAMLVVDGRENVLRYYDAIRNVCNERGIDVIKPMVAFSGTLNYGGETVTEEHFNTYNGKKVKSKDMAEVFDTSAFNLMIAADKFQVGFDQPYLTTMFVDKTLRDVEAVQTFSRLNRVIPGVKKHTHILDFVNSRETISEAFSRYYAGTKTEEGYDPYYIYERCAELEAMDVVLKEQVNMFGSKFKSTDKDALKKLSGLLEPARQRYSLLSEDDQDRFRKSAKSLVNQYNSVTVANNFIDPYFADLVNYLHYLLMVLPKRPQDPMPEIEKVISLDHYRLIYAGGGTIGVSNGDPIANPGPGKISGTPVPDLLSEVVRKMNLRWGLSDFNDNDKIEMLNNVAKEVITEISKTSDIAEYADWTNEAFKKQFHTMAKTRLLTRAMENGEFVEVLLNSTDALDEVTSNILDVVHMRSMSSKSESDGMN